MGRIRVEAPVDVDPLVIAQAVVGPHVLLKATYSKSWESRPFDRWAALQGLYEAVLVEYRAQLKRMVAAIRQELGVDELKKASKPALTPKEVAKLAKLIRDYHTAFVIQMGGDESLGKAEIARLTKMGILPPKAMAVVEDAYLYGQLAATIAAMDDPAATKKMTYKQFRSQIKKRPIPLTDQEKRAIGWAKQSFAVYTRKHGGKIADDVSTWFLEGDAAQRREFMGVAFTELQENIARRETVRQLASRIGDATGDWSRDLGRIAATTKQMAMQEGFAQGLIKREGPPDNILVAKLPRPDACPACVKLHLTAGQGSAPRVFPLSALIQNGSNVGKKRRNWKAVVGTVHPWCACELVHVPPGWGYQKEPPKGSGYKKVKGKKRWTKDGSKKGRPWRSKMVPAHMRTEKAFSRDLMKSFMTYENVPERGVSIRVGDPLVVREIEKVINSTPKEIFHKDVGVTLITTDSVRPLTALTDHDLAYWTGNEIRLSQTLSADKVEAVLRHEIGQTLNVHLIRMWGGEKPVREWHKVLF